MRTRRLTGFLLFFLLFNYHGASQSDNSYNHILKVVPASPNAASLGKYGNTPVSFYTGMPNISLPIMSIEQNSLKVPISLNYFSSGLKTEEIASWVGLGWSLNAGGVITRSVRGAADDGMNGYMTNQPFKVKFMAENLSSPNYKTQIEDYLRMAGMQGLYDLEPDIFHFNIGGLSGKFYYNQESGKFYTIPKQNIKVEYGVDGYVFVITAENGNRYCFSTAEVTSTSGSMCVGQPQSTDYSVVTTAWYLDKIENSNRTDAIHFEYTSYTYNFQNLTQTTKYFLYAQEGSVGYIPAPAMGEQNCHQFITLSARRLSRINFRNGYLLFTPQLTDRCDLPGDKALDKVELFNTSNRLIKRILFSYEYFGGTCDPSNQSLLRLKLKNIREETIQNGVAKASSPHLFEYSGEYLSAFPSRYTFAQDYWGYYNGVNGNQDLVPSMIYMNPTLGPQYLSGANRNPDPAKAQLGMINKITYPTGGSTEFTYEGNEVYDPLITPALQGKTEMLEGDHQGGVQTYYEKTFVIDYPPSDLNGHAQNGGVFVDIDFGEIGCEFINNQATTCAVLSLSGQTPGTPGFTITSNLQGVYLPNGTYKMSASFNQNPPGFADFYFRVMWNEVVHTTSYSRNAGGVRIKKIVDFDGVSHDKDFVRVFKYNKEGSDTSSGKILGVPSHYESDFTHEYYSGDPWGGQHGLIRYYKKRTSFSSYPLISVFGNYVGYERVEVQYGNAGENGKQEYTYSSMPDMVYGFPYPVTSREWWRGLMTSEKTYKKGNSGNVLAKEDHFSNGTTELTSLNDYSVAVGLKAGYNRGISNSYEEGKVPWYVVQRTNEVRVPLVEEFETFSGWSAVIADTTKLYNDINDGYITAYTLTSYNNDNLKPVSVETRNGNGTFKMIKYKYPVDYAQAAVKPAWISYLLDRQINSLPIETYTILRDASGNEYVVEGTVVIYKDDLPLPARSYKLQIAERLPLNQFTPSSIDAAGNLKIDLRYQELVAFDKYDAYFNLQQQHKINDLVYSYIWGYNNAYPIAQALNAASHEIFYTSFEDGADGSNDAQAKTGAKSYAGNYTLNFALPSGTSKQFVVTYWVHNGSKWEYKEENYTGTSKVLAGNKIDEVRVHPKGAQMTTYTYEPLVGMTSQTDINNNTTFYEYDGFGRLIHIRDKDGNILKKFCYNYQGQPEECQADTAPQWQSIGETTCITVTCADNPEYGINYQHHREVDGNPASASYNTDRWVNDGVRGACVTPANWQPYRTYCEEVNEVKTGNLVQEEKDMNPCSNTAGSVRISNITQNCTTCPYKPQNWVVQSTRCEVDASGRNTGNQILLERNEEPCSEGYYSTRETTISNPSACPLPQVYARMVATNRYWSGDMEYATFIIKFYSDAACTVALSVNNLSVNYKKTRTTCSGSSSTTSYTVVCTGTQYSLGTQMTAWDDGVRKCEYYDFYLAPGTGYIIK